MVKIFKHQGRVLHITFNLGQKWISFDRSGIMGWTGKRNFFFIYNSLLRNGKAF